MNIRENSLISITNNLNSTHKIIDCVNSKNFFLSNIILNNPLKLLNLKKNISGLVNKFNLIETQNLYISNTNSFLSDIILPLNISQNYIKLEDGINDYLPFSLVQNPIIKKLLKPIITKITGTQKFYFPNKKKII